MMGLPVAEGATDGEADVPDGVADGVADVPDGLPVAAAGAGILENP